MGDVHGALAIASRDLMKFVRDPVRLAGTFIFPFVMMTLMGGTLQSNLGHAAGFNFIGFTFTGVVGMTIFQSSAQGIASLLEDRKNDFAQELFVSPVSRYTIAFGKVMGETLVALAQAAPLVVLALVLGVSLTAAQVALLFPVAVVGSFLGGAFGLTMMAIANNQQAATQLFGFFILPQYFLAGVFSPITRLPWYLAALSAVSPMRYIVDLFRDVAYHGHSEYSRVVLLGPVANLAVISVMFVAFMGAGTALFVRRETNR